MSTVDSTPPEVSSWMVGIVLVLVEQKTAGKKLGYAAESGSLEWFCYTHTHTPV